jgi:hypothetical protein
MIDKPLNKGLCTITGGPPLLLAARTQCVKGLLQNKNRPERRFVVLKGTISVAISD